MGRWQGAESLQRLWLLPWFPKAIINTHTLVYWCSVPLGDAVLWESEVTACEPCTGGDQPWAQTPPDPGQLRGMDVALHTQIKNLPQFPFQRSERPLCGIPAGITESWHGRELAEPVGKFNLSCLKRGLLQLDSPLWERSFRVLVPRGVLAGQSVQSPFRAPSCCWKNHENQEKWWATLLSLLVAPQAPTSHWSGCIFYQLKPSGRFPSSPLCYFLLTRMLQYAKVRLKTVKLFNRTITVFLENVLFFWFSVP